jgi:phosphatidylserine decarboxylase
MKKLIFQIIPKSLASRCFGWVARVKIPVLSVFIKLLFIKMYNIPVEDAEYDVKEYATLQDFFVRRLKPGFRPIAESPIVSPVDGLVSQTGVLNDVQLKMIQAKNRFYSLQDLVPNQEASFYESFLGGAWVTIYLAPYNYHRIHSPIDGHITSTIYCPGTLWPVNSWSVNTIPDLFCVNERIISVIQQSYGNVLLAKIGATNVGRISLSYNSELISNTAAVPGRSQKSYSWAPKQPIKMMKGQELAVFELGSTVVLILDKNTRDNVANHFLDASGKPIQMGQIL